MSGRAYARDSENTGLPGGARDLNSIVPHKFVVPVATTKRTPKELAIRRAIRKRCKEKNWKKLIALKYRRHSSDDPSAQEPVSIAPIGINQENLSGKQQTGTGNGASATEKREIEEMKLQELEARLQEIDDRKTAKFVELKELLAAEAKSKAT